MLGQMIWGNLELAGGTYLITTLFTGLVIGAGAFALSVLPRWQDDEERARTRKEEAARAAKPTPVVELRKAA